MATIYNRLGDKEMCWSKNNCILIKTCVSLEFTELRNWRKNFHQNSGKRLLYIRKVWKNVVLLLESTVAAAEGWVSTLSKTLVKHWDVIDLVLSHRTIPSIASKNLSIVHQMSVLFKMNVQDDQCVKCQTETTVRYKWLSWKLPKLTSRLIKPQSLHTQRLFDDCLCQKSMILCHMC